MKYLLIITMFLISSLQSCDDDDNHPAAQPEPQLPEATMDALNTAGFVIKEVDGTTTNWVPYATCDGLTTNPCDAIHSNASTEHQESFDGGFMDVQLSRKTEETRTSFYLSVIDIEGEGDYSENVVQFQLRGDGHLYGPWEASTVELIITRFDEQEQIISGTFSANGLKDSDENSIDIEDGRFDLSFDACVCM